MIYCNEMDQSRFLSNDIKFCRRPLWTYSKRSLTHYCARLQHYPSAGCGIPGLLCMHLSSHPNWRALHTRHVLPPVLLVGITATTARHLDVLSTCDALPQHVLVAGGFVYTHTQKHTHTHKHTNTSTHTHTQTHTHTHNDLNTHTHTHTHTHTPNIHLEMKARALTIVLHPFHPHFCKA